MNRERSLYDYTPVTQVTQVFLLYFVVFLFNEFKRIDSCMDHRWSEINETYFPDTQILVMYMGQKQLLFGFM